MSNNLNISNLHISNRALPREARNRGIRWGAGRIIRIGRSKPRPRFSPTSMPNSVDSAFI